MSPQPKIVVTQHIHKEVQERLSAHGLLDMNSGSEPWPRTEVMQRVSQATALMGFMTDQIDQEILHAAPHLKIVACALKGYDNYDVHACTKSGVWLSIVPDLLTEPTAELAIGLAISLARHVRQSDAYIRSGQFQGWRTHFYGMGLHGSSVAIVGLGQVGCAIAQRLEGFGCERVLGVDPHAQPTGVELVSLEFALQHADYLFLATPLLPSTHHLISAQQLALSKPGQLIINVGRGSVVDESAIAQALYSEKLGGYAADVFECEDWQLPQRPLQIRSDLLAHSNTLLTPHIGSAVKKVRIAIEHSAADNIIAVLQGKAPPNAINTPVEVI
jgi:phosphonate dehydrogenase